MLNVFTTVEFQVVEFSVVSQNWLIWLYLLLNSTNSWPQGTGLAPRSICSPVPSPRLLHHDVRLAIGYVSTRELNEIGSGVVIRSITWAVNNSSVLLLNRGCTFIKKKFLLPIVHVSEYIKYKIKWNNKCYRINKILVH